MNYVEALKFLDTPEEVRMTTELFEFTQVCKDALEKQIPKKPMDRFSMAFDCDMGKCSTCQEGINQQMNYCDHCGQAIDWSDNQ